MHQLISKELSDPNFHPLGIADMDAPFLLCADDAVIISRIQITLKSSVSYCNKNHLVQTSSRPKCLLKHLASFRVTKDQEINHVWIFKYLGIAFQESWNA